MVCDGLSKYLQEALSLFARAASRIITENNLRLPQELRMGYFKIDPILSCLLGRAAIILGKAMNVTSICVFGICSNVSVTMVSIGYHCQPGCLAQQVLGSSIQFA
jgi:hypothetical protein